MKNTKPKQQSLTPLKKGKPGYSHNGFIFDEKEVLQRKVFVADKLNDNVFSYGFFLPRNETKTDKKSGITYTEQIECPVLITSNNNLLIPDKRLEELESISFPRIPYFLPRRWPLASIKKYLKGKETFVHKEKIFQNIKDIYKRFLYFQADEWYDVHSLWDIGTYFFMLFDNFPIFKLSGLAGTAKTKIMQVSQMLTLNAGNILINPSEASLFRETDEKRPTKYFDEAENLFSYSGKKLLPDPRRELINGSYSKGSTVPRVEKFGNRFATVHYHCYSPTMIASINQLSGPTETRSISHIMTRTPDADPRGECEVQETCGDEFWQEIRSSLYIFALQNWNIIEEGGKKFQAEGIKMRDLQIWKPLLVLAMLIDQDLYSRTLNFAVQLSSQRQDDFIPDDSFNYDVLKALKNTIITNNGSKPYVEDIKKQYLIFRECPEDLAERYLNRKISRCLDRLGFKEFRKRDMRLSYFDVTLDRFYKIIQPICPDLLGH